MRISLHRLLNLVLKLVLIATVVFILVDPGNEIFALKEVSFFCLFFVWLIIIIVERSHLKYSKNLIIHLILFASTIPLYTFFIGYFHTSSFNLTDGLKYIKAFIFSISIFIILERKIDFYKYFSYTSLVVVGLTIYLFLTIDKFSLTEHYYFQIKNAAFISRRIFGSILIDPVIFYKTSPVLILTLSYFCNLLFIKTTGLSLRRIFYLVVILGLIFTLIISATRMNWISMFIIVIIYFGRYIRNNSKILFSLFVITFLIVGIIIFPPFLKQTVFNSTESSNVVKMGHLSSYIVSFKENPQYLLTGQGFGTYFYSYGAEKKVQQTELTYLEIIRMMGIPIALLFIFLLVFPYYAIIKKKDKNYFNISLGYLLYLFEIGSNPLLFGSTGILVYVLVLSKSFGSNVVKSEDKENEYEEYD
jgi:hypothetical protein